MEFEPVIYPKEVIPGVLDEFYPLLELSAKESFGMLTADHLAQMLRQGDATAFAMRKGEKVVLLVVADFVYYSTFKSMRVLALAGSHLEEAAKFLPALEAWAITQGAVEIEGWCRPGMERFHQRFGLKKRVTLMVKDLRGKLQ